VNEVRNAIGRLKIGKAIGSDGIPNEAWKYGGEEMEKWMWEICKRMWRRRMAGTMERRRNSANNKERGGARSEKTIEE